MFKKLLLAAAFSLTASSAFAVCSQIPLNIKDSSANVVAMSSASAADGNCKTYIDADTSSQIHADLTAALPAGTNLIGDVNLRQGGTVLSATNGTFENILQGNAVLSATNGLFSNQLQGNAVLSATNPSFSAPIPTTTGGLSVYNVQPAASDNHVVIKAGAGQVYKVDVFNNSATVNYIRLYNATTGFNGCNSATNIVWQGIIPASTSGAGLSSSWDLGIAFATGISICVTSGYAQTDTTAATASALIVNVGYK